VTVIFRKPHTGWGSYSYDRKKMLCAWIVENPAHSLSRKRAAFEIRVLKIFETNFFRQR